MRIGIKRKKGKWFVLFIGTSSYELEKQQRYMASHNATNNDVIANDQDAQQDHKMSETFAGFRN